MIQNFTLVNPFCICISLICIVVAIATTLLKKLKIKEEALS